MPAFGPLSLQLAAFIQVADRIDRDAEVAGRLAAGEPSLRGSPTVLPRCCRHGITSLFLILPLKHEAARGARLKTAARSRAVTEAAPCPGPRSRNRALPLRATPSADRPACRSRDPPPWDPHRRPRRQPRRRLGVEPGGHAARPRAQGGRAAAPTPSAASAGGWPPR